MKDSTLTRPAKVSSNSHDGVNSINGLGHTRPMATEARPNPVILEDDNEASTSRENAGQYKKLNIYLIWHNLIWKISKVKFLYFL